MSRRLLACVALVVAFASAGCGDDPKPQAKPANVPEGLVPPTVQNGEFAFFKSEIVSAEEAFANGGPKSLASDGELWELRKGDRLVGSLQLTTVMPEVDLANKDHRGMILNQLLPTARDQVLIDEVNVWGTETKLKATYLWFGRDIFALMTLKGGSEDNLDPNLVLTEVVGHTAASDNWKPLYIDEEVEI